MSSDWLILLELLLVFGVVGGFCVRELLWLRRDRRERERRRAEAQAGTPPPSGGG